MARTETSTHCPYCALQCGMKLRPVTDGGVVEVVERTEFPVNRGALCGKGRTAPAVLAAGVRLTGPLVRDEGGELTPASWDEALERIADGLRGTRAEHGADAVGVFGGGGLTNEKAYALGKFARVVLGTSQIDYNGRFCMSSAAAAHQRAFGLDRGLPFPLEDIPRTGCVILVGSNLAETMPPALRYLTELRENGGRLIVIDPRRTRTAEQADLHLAPRPGTDLALALGMLHLVVAEGRVDEEFVRARTNGWDEARAGAMAHWPELVERLTGVPVPQLREAVEMFCGAGRGGKWALELVRRLGGEGPGITCVEARVSGVLTGDEDGRVVSSLPFPFVVALLLDLVFLRGQQPEWLGVLTFIF